MRKMGVVLTFLMLASLLVPVVAAQDQGPQIVGNGVPKAVPAAPNPEVVLWDQYANWSGVDFAAQDFETAYDVYDIYAGDDLENAESWGIDTIVTRGGWGGFVDLNNASAIHWYIYADEPGKPAGFPGDGTEFWSLSLPPSEVGLGVYEPEDVVLTLDTPLCLPPGHWWLVYYASLEFGVYGQYGWSGTSDPVWGYTAMQANPGGGFGMGSDWWTNTYGADQMFRLEGTPGCLPPEDPDIDVTPASLSAEQCPDTITQQTLQICNVGGADLTWALTEAAGVLGTPAPNGPKVTLPEGAPQSLAEWLALGKPAFQVQPVAPNVTAAPEALTFYTTRGTFDGDYPGLPVEGYQNGDIPYGSIPAIAHPLDQNSNNGYFVPGDILPGIQFWASTTWYGDEIALLGEQAYYNLSNTAVANYFTDSYIIQFNPPVQAAGMDLQEYVGSYSCQVDIYDTNGYLASATSGCDEDGVFWGVASDAYPITQLVITSLGGGAEGADNIAFGGEEAFDAEWLSEDPTGGTIPAGGCVDVTVTFDSTDLAAGDYFANLVIDSNDPDEPTVTVPVQLTVLECGNTLTCGSIEALTGLDPYGRLLVKWKVLVVDGSAAPVAAVMTTANLTSPVIVQTKVKMSNAIGIAKFAQGSAVSGDWSIDVTDMFKDGYTFVDGAQCYAAIYY